MARNNGGGAGALPVGDYRHEASRRKNNPPAKLAAEGRVPAVPKLDFSYNPHLDPVLRSDPSAKSDHLPELLASARKRPLTDEEAQILANALRRFEPWLEWAGKRENDALSVEPVALHIHERVSAQAILRAAARKDVSRDLFADPKLSYREAVRFYQHDVDWSNRLILGDSLQVMASLAQREDLAGKVQMVYLDPPYGIRFGSNFQSEIRNRDVGDQESDITREPETIKAFRDTWVHGIHSYLRYLRDRFVVARELLKPDGSIFVQIGDDNLPTVTLLLDEIFGAQNRIQLITIKKKSSTQKGQSVVDYVIWYAKDKSLVKMPDLYTDPGEPEDAEKYRKIELETGERRPVHLVDDETRTERSKYYVREDYPVVSQHYSKTRTKRISVEGREVYCGDERQWRYDIEKGMRRLERCGRLRAGRGSAFGVAYWGDSRLASMPNVWTDVHGEASPVYVVQTNRKIVERCMLMSTEPGDLVLDPTCGSGTTAFVAEQWGRRWITVDTSRVAIAIARQRLLTSSFDYYKLKDPKLGVDGGIECKTVGHITLRSVAQNDALDPILDKHDAILDQCLAALNEAAKKLDSATHQKLAAKLLRKQRSEGRRAVTEADLRRWQLPADGRFDHWTVPFDDDPDWPAEMTTAVRNYRAAWRRKMDEINEVIGANAAQAELIDQPIIQPGVTRVSGPFTVEAVQPAETSLDEIAAATPIAGAPPELEDAFEPSGPVEAADEARNAEAYLAQMIRLLRADGVRFPDNRQMAFSRLEALSGQSQALHAEGRWTPEGEADNDPNGDATVCVAFGPQYGPVTARQVEQLMRVAARRGYDDLVIAGFNFDGAAQAVIEEADHPNLRVHMAHIRPDVNPGMKGLLKDTPRSQLFTVFGQPRSTLGRGPTDDEFVVRMEGVDIYDPLTNTVANARADKVAAWFVDTDYDGRTFCVTQAFFPDKTAWSKLAEALSGVVDEGAFASLSGTQSLPFTAGEHACVAVKVIDPRGNEVLRLHRLEVAHGA